MGCGASLPLLPPPPSLDDDDDRTLAECVATFERTFLDESCNLKPTVRALAMAPDGKTLYSGAKDETVRAWSLPSGECVATFKGHSGWVLALAMAPDGKTIYSGSVDKNVKAWSLPGGECVATFKGHSGWVTALAMAPDGGALEAPARCCSARGGVSRREGYHVSWAGVG
jgi:WD40 repeat protein